MTTKSTIIKLRQREATSIDSDEYNGSFSVSLNNPVMMKDGDVLRAKSVFLDTASTSLITVPPNTTVSLEFVRYITNYNVTNSQPKVNPNPTPDFIGEIPGKLYTPTEPTQATAKVMYNTVDYKRYFECETSQTAHAGTTVNILDSITIIPLHKNASRRFAKNMILRFDIGEVDKDGNTIPYTITTKKDGYDAQINRQGVTLLGINKICPLSVVTLLNTPTELNDAKISKITIAVKTPPTTPTAGAKSVTCQPRLYKMDIPVPAGVYSPGRITTFLNNQLSLLGPKTSAVDITDNPFLTPLSEIVLKDTANGTNTVWLPEETSTVDADGNTIYPLVEKTMSFKPDPTFQNSDGSGNDFWVGTNQIALEFDNDTSKIGFEIMHFPVYVANTEDPAEPGMIYTANDNVPIGNYGGVALTSLTPTSFWFDQLGFTTDNLISINYPGVDKDDGTLKHAFWRDSVGTGNSFKLINPPSICDIRPGENVTNAYLSIDNPVHKASVDISPAGAAPADRVYEAQYWLPDTANERQIVTSLTLPIVANREFDTVENDEGYFLLEIGVKFPQNMVSGMGGNNRNAVQSIIGKFYTSGSFLQDTGGGSITYTHSGETQIISSLDVRVLHADGSPPTTLELGPKNTIFLELLKQILPVPIDAMPKKKAQ